MRRSHPRHLAILFLFLRRTASGRCSTRCFPVARARVDLRSTPWHPVLARSADCSANSEPLSNVMVFTGIPLDRSDWITAFATTLALSVSTFATTRKRVHRSSNVTRYPSPTPPDTVSPSQSPIRSRFFHDLGPFMDGVLWLDGVVRASLGVPSFPSTPQVLPAIDLWQHPCVYGPVDGGCAELLLRMHALPTHRNLFRRPIPSKLFARIREHFAASGKTRLPHASFPSSLLVLIGRYHRVVVVCLFRFR